MRTSGLADCLCWHPSIRATGFGMVERETLKYPRPASPLERLESRQDELLRRLDELEEQTRRVLEEQTDWLRAQSARLRPQAAELLKALETELRPLPLAG